MQATFKNNLILTLNGRNKVAIEKEQMNSRENSEPHPTSTEIQPLRRAWKSAKIIIPPGY